MRSPTTTARKTASEKSDRQRPAAQPSPASVIERLLPLKAADCHLLMALAREEMYGYALLQAMTEDSRGRVGMDIGALYRALDRIMRSGLIVESGRRDPEPNRGKPRRYYAITELGREVLGAEIVRLQRVLEVARPEVARS